MEKLLENAKVQSNQTNSIYNYCFETIQGNVIKPAGICQNKKRVWDASSKPKKPEDVNWIKRKDAQTAKNCEQFILEFLNHYTPFAVLKYGKERFDFPTGGFDHKKYLNEVYNFFEIVLQAEILTEQFNDQLNKLNTYHSMFKVSKESDPKIPFKVITKSFRNLIEKKIKSINSILEEERQNNKEIIKEKDEKEKTEKDDIKQQPLLTPLTLLEKKYLIKKIERLPSNNIFVSVAVKIYDNGTDRYEFSIYYTIGDDKKKERLTFANKRNKEKIRKIHKIFLKFEKNGEKKIIMKNIEKYFPLEKKNKNQKTENKK